MSKDNDTIQSVLNRYNEHEEIILQTLSMIEEVQKVDLHIEKEYIKRKYINLNMVSAIDYRDKELFFDAYRKKKVGQKRPTFFLSKAERALNPG
jgi:hypothetical protein